MAACFAKSSRGLLSCSAPPVKRPCPKSQMMWKCPAVHSFCFRQEKHLHLQDSIKLFTFGKEGGSEIWQGGGEGGGPSPANGGASHTATGW